MSLDINQEIQEYFRTQGAILIDVRTPQEYRKGHIPRRINIPLRLISRAQNMFKSKDTPLFVHCYTGSRSWRAVEALERMGYRKVKDIGGLAGYRGKLEGQ